MYEIGIAVSAALVFLNIVAESTLFLGYIPSNFKKLGFTYSFLSSDFRRSKPSDSSLIWRSITLLLNYALRFSFCIFSWATVAYQLGCILAHLYRILLTPEECKRGRMKMQMQNLNGLDLCESFLEMRLLNTEENRMALLSEIERQHNKAS